MNWGEWLENDAGEALSQWKQAAKEISQRFDLFTGRKVKKASAKQNERAFWLLVHKPLDGVRLLAVRLPIQGNSKGQIEMRIWSYADRKDVGPMFEYSPTFTFRGSVFKPYTCTPQDSWKLELKREGVEVHGKVYSGQLADVGEPGEAVTVLRSLFESFSDFVLEHHQKLAVESDGDDYISPSDGSSTPSRSVATVISIDTRTFENEHEEKIAEFEKTLSSLSISEREAIMKIRVGQSSFREKLLTRWNFACSVTGLKFPEILIASHIKRWSDCETAAERWDVNNGLLLTPSLDKAFELGLIGFEHEGIHRGRLIVSAKVDWELRGTLRLDNPQWHIRYWFQGLTPYLLHHRQRWAL
ncbi:HNH endonuclease signature motif containing protein [Delftia acidovorans]|uniref:HNH endonuclease n=1 Tax=Delftia acidovorans TaxID=80866 RepID=UPI0032DF0855